MKARGGFTLLELLIALALLAVIGAGLAAALRLGTQTYTRSQALGEGSVEIATRMQMRRLLETATAPNLLTPFPKAFTGSNTSLQFVTLASVGFARDAAGLRVSLALEGDTLKIAVEPFDDKGTILRSYTEVLAADARALDITYFADDEWQSGWSNTAKLPQLVSIALADGSEPDWPEFTVKLIYAD